MKKIICVFAAVVLSLCLLCGCGGGKGTEGDAPATVSVFAPDGAPAISLSKMIADDYAGVEFNIVQPTDIAAQVVSGAADIAIMPTNAAAVQYTRGVEIAMLGVTNFGSLYLVGKGEEVTSLESLKGKVVYSIGQGNVPDLVFRILLKEANIEYRFDTAAKEGVVSLAYVSEGTEFIGGLTAGKMNYGVISEPAATVAQKKVEGAKRMLDIQKLYGEAFGGTGYPQAALVVKKSLLENRRDFVAQFVKDFAAGAKWAESEPQAALAAIKKVEEGTSIPMLTAEIAKGCNLGFTAAADAKTQLVNFYNKLGEVKREGETPIGATLPADDFYLENLNIMSNA